MLTMPFIRAIVHFFYQVAAAQDKLVMYNISHIAHGVHMPPSVISSNGVVLFL